MSTPSEVSVEYAEAHIAELLRRAEAGETIIVKREDQAVVQLRGVASEHPALVPWDLPDRERLLEALAPDDDIADAFEGA